jgi:hypothetical protein
LLFLTRQPKAFLSVLTRCHRSLFPGRPQSESDH